MPNMDGYEVCRQLKDDPKTAEIPIIFLTVKGSVEDELKGFSLHYAVRYRMFNREGRELWMLSKASVVEEGSDGKPARLAGTQMDITEQEQTTPALVEAKAEAEEANQVKARFLANMSHELRTPINAVMGFANLAPMTKLTPQQEEYISKIKNSSVTMTRLIEDILEFAQLKAGKLAITYLPFSLTEVLENIAGIYRIQAAGKQLAFGIESRPEVPVDCWATPCGSSRYSAIW